VRSTLTAAAAGFDSALLPGETLLDKLPPLEEILEFKSVGAHVLKGREILYKYPEGWFRGRVLKPATDATVKDNKRICNFMVFFEEDDELINRPLYSRTYVTNAKAVVHSWVLLAVSSAGERAPLDSEAPAARLLALMPPTLSMDELD
jgi:hypothetical protein